ncbi:MAG: hypothetical protein HOY71_04060 [Nonomuraea sp.]|nr:hypothetical protein [Nonomuraea sp.]
MAEPDPGPPGVAVDPRYLRRRRLLVTGAAVLALAAVLSVLAITRPPPLRDEPGAFGDDLSEVMGLIQAENQRVLREHPGDVVTLAHLLPLTGDYSDIAMTREAVRHSLEGAYLAQRWRNRQQKTAPYVRLLVGDLGPDTWAATVRAVRQERILAVTGLGASTRVTTRAIEELSADPPMPAVAAVITSDELQGKPGLTRVAPLNSAEAAGGVWKAGRLDPGYKAVIVDDKHATDSYSQTLGRSYQRLIEPAKLIDKLSFDSSAKAAGTVIGKVAEAICDSAATTVFYTGRANELPLLLSKLAQVRRCETRDLAVISGDDIAQMNPGRQDMNWSDNGGHVALYYTAMANPSLGKPALPALQDRFKSDRPDSFYTVFRNESLEDSEAIMHHDAVTVAIAAIDEFAANEPNSGWRRIGPDSVVSMLRSGTIKVEGASGPIALGENGNPIRKGFPILRLLPSGISTNPEWYPG